jgi:hypothetical protein
MVPGRTKKECVARFKEIRQRLFEIKQQKEQEAAAAAGGAATLVAAAAATPPAPAGK